MGYGKLIAAFGAILAVLKPLLVVIKVNAPDWLFFVGVIFIIIGALVHLAEKM